MIEIRDLCFLDVLKNINLNFDYGKIYLITGDNGSGKTVLFKNILGILNRNSGEIIIDGIDNTAYKGQIGALIEDPDFMLFNSGLDNLKFLSSIRGKFNKKYVLSLLIKFNLYNDRNRIVRKYSLGMKKKLGIIQAIMEDQQIILLDEPTNGLDECSINAFYEVVLELKRMNKLVIIASHTDTMINELVDNIITIDKGKILTNVSGCR